MVTGSGTSSKHNKSAAGRAPGTRSPPDATLYTWRGYQRWLKKIGAAQKKRRKK